VDNSPGRTGKLADLIDSPLELAKEKIDQYMDIDAGADTVQVRCVTETQNKKLLGTLNVSALHEYLPHTQMS
jgi:hypothetical protein